MVPSPLRECLGQGLYLVVVVEFVLAPVGELLEGEDLLRGFYLSSFYLHRDFCGRRIIVASGGSVSDSECGCPWAGVSCALALPLPTPLPP
jgi:hypothetical protein